MNLIESAISLTNLVKTKPKFNLLIPVWASPKGHELANKISFVYYRTGDGDGIINFNHIDADSVGIFDIKSICDKDTLVFGNRYVRTEGLDYEWVYFEEYGTPFVLNEFAESLYRGYRTDFKELNDCIPLMKWYELLRTVPDIKNRQDWYYTYSAGINELGRLEGAGVKVVEEKFIDTFDFPKQHMTNGIVYTKYNPYTVTGRPSNRHLGVNWSALNKSDGTRKSIISRFPDGTLIGFDYESYHIRIIGRLIGYTFPKGQTAHEHLAGYYGVDAETAKGITFTYLYGGITDDVREVPFFQKVAEWIDTMWSEFVISGELVTPIFRRRVHFARIESPTKQKVFNYLLQALETEINYRKIGELNDLFTGLNSRLILYTYDAFLIDVHPTERKRVLNDVKSVLERGGFPVRCYEGNNYDEMDVIG